MAGKLTVIIMAGVIGITGMSMNSYGYSSTSPDDLKPIYHYQRFEAIMPKIEKCDFKGTLEEIK